MDSVVRSIYLCFYKNELELPHYYNISYKIDSDYKFRLFIQNYSTKGSFLYYKYLEYKSKEAIGRYGVSSCQHQRGASEQNNMGNEYVFGKNRFKAGTSEE